ncbi:MAG: hypothetical protein ACR2OE_18090 [Thermomicrobiales bacterium]
MYYELWDMRSNNLVADFDNERDALLLVLEARERNGDCDTDTLSLDICDDDGDTRETQEVIYGQALARYAHERLTPRQPASRTR